MDLLKVLKEEKSSNYKGGIYHHTQIKLSYNSNRIEGSKISEQQTRHIFETNSFIPIGNETIHTDDVLETINHFECFDYILKIADQPLTEQHIKHMHLLLKNNTTQSKKDWFNVGDYKLKPNEVGGIETTSPEKVKMEMSNLIDKYRNLTQVSLKHIIDFHYHFEIIHPFQDGNGRVGRLIMFKECLHHNVIPFIIQDEYKAFYYRGLSEYSRVKEYLIDTCLSAQDDYKKVLNYFFPDERF